MQDWKMREQNYSYEKCGTNPAFPENVVSLCVSKIILIVVEMSTLTRTTPLSHIFNTETQDDENTNVKAL